MSTYRPDAIWRFASTHPWLTCIGLYLVQVAFTLDARALWFSDEVRYAEVYSQLLNGHWWVLHLGDAFYPDKPPLYFWLLRLLQPLAGGVSERLFFLGSAVSGLMVLAASMFLARTMFRDPRVTAATGLTLVTSIFFATVAHYSRMDLPFAALIALSQWAFYRMLTSDGQSRGPALAAFGLAAAATLVKGPLGLGLPLAAMLAFAAWSGRLRRLLSADMAWGLGLYLLAMAVWLGGAWHVEGRPFVDNILGTQVIGRAVSSWHHREPWYYYLYVLPLAWLPWSLLPLALRPGRLFDAAFRTELWRNRRNAGPEAYVWCMLLGGLTLLSAISGKIPGYLIPLLPPLALLNGLALARLTTRRAPRVWLLVGSFLLSFGLAALFVEFAPIPQVCLRGLGLTLLLAGGTGWALIRLRHANPRTALGVMAVGVSLWVVVLAGVTAPSLDPLMSTRDVGLRMRHYIEQGHAPVVHDVFSGVFNYYAGHTPVETKRYEDLEAFLTAHPKAVVTMRAKHWRRWENPPANLRIVDQRRIIESDYVVAVSEEE